MSDANDRPLNADEYPVGRCPACGHGLLARGGCDNEDCSNAAVRKDALVALRTPADERDLDTPVVRELAGLDRVDDENGDLRADDDVYGRVGYDLDEGGPESPDIVELDERRAELVDAEVPFSDEDVLEPPELAPELEFGELDAVELDERAAEDSQVDDESGDLSAEDEPVE